ncbi:hypothetical protein ACFLSS_00310 [Bacteroidota bacterium]
MKFITKFIAIPIFLTSHSLPQFYADSTIPDYVMEFMKIADETARKYDSGKGLLNPLTDEEIKHVAELYYKCYNNNPVVFLKYVNDLHQKWRRTFLDVVTGKMKLRPWLKVYKLRDQISNKYGIQFSEVIGTPALLRARYVSRSKNWFTVNDDWLEFRYKYFIFVLEDILKGSKYFSIRDTVRVISIGNVESPSPKFIAGDSYLIPLRPLIDSEEYDGQIAFNHLHDYYDGWAMGQPPKTFPIIDEKITNADYFGISDTSWIDFKKYFKEKFLIFD